MRAAFSFMPLPWLFRSDRGRGRWVGQSEGHAARRAGARRLRHRRQISARRCGRLFHLCRYRGCSDLIVVAVGGLGSLKGTLLAALVLGVFDTGGKYLLADAGGFFIYAVTVAVPI